MLFVPKWLGNRRIDGTDCQLLAAFANEAKIGEFQEITAEKLQNCSLRRRNLTEYYKLIRLLNLYGVYFDGYASRYSLTLETKPKLLSVPALDERLIQTSQLERRISIFLINLGIEKFANLNGIGLNILAAQTAEEEVFLEEIFKKTGVNIISEEDEINAFYQQPLKSNITYSSRSSEETNGNVMLLTEAEVITEDEIKVLEIPVSISNTESTGLTIKDLNLSLRSYNVLLRNNIKTVGELIKLSEEKLLEFKNCGKLALNNIKDALAEHGLSLESHELEIPNNSLKAIVSTEQVESAKAGFEEVGISSEFINTLISHNILTTEQLLEFPPKCLSFLFKDNKNLLSHVQERLQQAGVIYDLQGHHISSDCQDSLLIPSLENPLMESLSELTFSKPIQTNFAAHNIKYLWQLCCLEPQQIYQIVGSKIQEVVDLLEKIGIIQTPLPINPKEFVLNQFAYLINKLDKELPNLLKKQKNVEIYHQRKLGLKGGKTLQELGELHGVTRERVRQLQAKNEKKILDWFMQESVSLKSTLNTCLKEANGIVDFKPIIAITSEDSQVLSRLFELTGYSCLVDLNTQAIWDNRIYYEKSDSENLDIFLKVIDELNNSDEISPQEISSQNIKDSITSVLIETIRPLYGEVNTSKMDWVIERIAAVLIAEHLIENQSGTYRLKSVSFKKLVIEEFGKLYPNGEYIYKNGQSLWETLCKAVPELEQRGGVRYIAQIFPKSPSIFLWGVGFYIHRDNVHVDWKLVDKAIEQSIEKFDQGISEIKVHLLFQKARKDLMDANIPTPQALYSLLRYKKPARLVLEDYPRIQDANANLEKTTLKQMLEEFVYAHHEKPVSKELLTSHFCNEMGWMSYQLDSLIKHSQNVLLCGKRSYIHRDFLTINQSALKEFLHRIEEELTSQTSFHIRHLRSKYPVIWTEVCSSYLSSESMAKLLSELEEPNFQIHGSTITRQEDEGSLKLSEEISNWAYQSGEFVTKEQLQQEFSGNKGYSSYALNLALHWSNLMQCYKDSYIHPDLIGCNDATVSSINELIQAYATARASQGLPFSSFKAMINDCYTKLPKLNNFYWTPELLTHIVEKSDIALIFNEVYVLKENSFDILDLDDLMAFIIAKVFSKIRIEVKELEKYLRAQGVIGIASFIPKNEVFFDGSSIELVDEESIVQLSKIGRERYM